MKYENKNKTTHKTWPKKQITVIILVYFLPIYYSFSLILLSSQMSYIILNIVFIYNIPFYNIKIYPINGLYESMHVS